MRVVPGLRGAKALLRRRAAAATLLAFMAAVHLRGDDMVEFVWKGKNADVPGAASKVIRREVPKGKGAVLVARRDAKRPTARIVLAANPTRSAQIAAAEFQHYVEKITGERLAVMTDEGRPRKEGRILIGESRLTRALGLKSSDFDEQEYLIRTYGDLLVLIGRDEPEYGLVNYDRHDLWGGFAQAYDWSLKPERAKKLGTVYAVHDFLRKCAGLRWYMPGDIGEVCPRRDRLQVRDLDIRRKPWTTYRWIGMHAHRPDYLAKGDWSLRDVVLWQLRLKLFGGEAFHCNHSLIAQWMQQRFPDDREILAKGYERPTQLCLSSERLLKIVCQDADDYFAGKTNHARTSGDYFPVMPHDTSHYCKCDKCQAVIKSPEESIPTFWSDRASNYVWGLVQRVAAHVKTTNPGKWVGCCAYAKYSTVPDAPELAQLGDNVFAMVCRSLPGAVRSVEYEAQSRQLLADWAKTVKRWYVWEYFSHLQGQRDPGKFPGVFLHVIRDDMKLLHSLGCRGVFNEYETYLRDCALSHLNVYMHLRLMDDIDYDVDQGLDEYCELFYGPAAAPMKRILVRMEEQYVGIRNMTLAPTARSLDWSQACSSEVLSELRGLVEQALAKATDEPYARRVRFFRDEVLWLLEKHTLREEAVAKKGGLSLTASFVAKGHQDLTGEKGRIPHFVRMDGDPTELSTQAWVGYDKANLYVRAVCAEPDMSSLRAVVKPEDQATEGINQDDSFELFIDVGRTRQDYYQLLINTNGVVRDQYRHHMRGWDREYNAHAVVAPGKSKDGWRLEVTIPLSSLTPDRRVTDKTVWGLNLCRNRMRREQGGFRAKDAYTSWAPTFHGFHQPQCFGLLRFAAGPR